MRHIKPEVLLTLLFLVLLTMAYACNGAETEFAKFSREKSGEVLAALLTLVTVARSVIPKEPKS